MLFPMFLWRLHRNEPGCIVGEHIHVFFWPEIGRLFFVVMIWFDMDRLGDIDRGSIENRTPEERGAGLYRLTRVGDAARWWL